eukprot:2255888-Pleurochrysis_carterae.AAC.2
MKHSPETRARSFRSTPAVFEMIYHGFSSTGEDAATILARAGLCTRILAGENVRMYARVRGARVCQHCMCEYRVRTHLFELLDVVDLHSGHKLHGEYARRRDIQIHFWNLPQRFAETIAEASGSLRRSRKAQTISSLCLPQQCLVLTHPRSVRVDEGVLALLTFQHRIACLFAQPCDPASINCVSALRTSAYPSTT